MAEKRTCDQCGAEVPANAPEGLCPRCLARMGLRLAPRLDPPPPLEGPSPPRLRYFGDYELLEEIARGGMGVVYKARQMSLNRVVAVKMLLSGPTADGTFVKRFQAEARAVAGLHHPNIVAIHEIGVHEGQHYFSMDYVEGQTLEERGRDNAVPPALAADYLQTIARAVHCAHGHGVLHRDLKPSNVLVDALDQPRVTDFGLAKRLRDHSDLTHDGQIMGTPNYMAPEQASGNRAELGPATDVYALGAILYYLLTGRPPFLSQSLEEALGRLLHSEPVAPRLLTPAIPRDLETICLKCLEKDPRQRYLSAQALADDLGRWLRREPIRARPSTPPERVIKWIRRKPAIAALSALLLLGASLGIPALLWKWRQATQHAIAERRARDRADAALSEVQIQIAERMFADNETSMALAYLALVLRQNATNPVVAGRVFSNLTHQVLIVPLVHPLHHDGPVYLAQFSPDGRRVVTASGDGTAQVWDANTGQPVTPPLKHRGPVWFAQFSPDSLRVVTASEDKTAQIWDANTGQPVTPPLEHAWGVGFAYFSPDGKRVVTDTWEPDWTLRLWDAQSGLLLSQPITNVHRLRCYPFSPDGQRLVTSYGGHSAQIWNAITGAPLLSLNHDDFVWTAEFSLDGQRVITACRDGTARIWDGRKGKQTAPPLYHGESLWTAHLSPDGRWVVTVCNDTTIQLWDANTGRALTGPRYQTTEEDAAEYEAYEARVGPVHQETPRYAQFSPDGNLLLIAFGRSPQLLSAESGTALTAPFQHDLLRSAEFAPDSQRVVTASLKGTVLIWGIKIGDHWRHSSLTNAPAQGFDRRLEVGSEPVPAWVPALLESIAQQHLVSQDLTRPVDEAEFWSLKKQLLESRASDPWTMWAQWLLTAPPAR
jgi:eukaryotic-like serine/threonine-protein kinase